MKISSLLPALCAFALLTPSAKIPVSKTFTLDSLGACQGVTFFKGKYYLYGDRETGVMRRYSLTKNDSLLYDNKEYHFTIDGQNTIKHPTGIANHKGLPVFIGNSVRQGAGSNVWKAMIYSVNWEGLLEKGTLDGNLINTIEDDAAIQGSRPEYVRYLNKWYVATADYGNKANEVRLYNPEMLSKASKTSEKGVVAYRFSCSPWVQNLHYIDKEGMLILVQNQVEGRRWRLTFLDLRKSIESGTEKVLKVIETDRSDELEGFMMIQGSLKGIAVTSSRQNNASILNLSKEP